MAKIPARKKKLIAECRFQVDSLDIQLLNLLNRRAELARELAEVKHRVGMAVSDREREQDLLGRLLAANPGPLDSGALLRIFRRIIFESRRLQEREVEDRDSWI